MTKKPTRELKARDPFGGVPYGVNALIRNEGSTLEELPLNQVDSSDDLWRLRPAEHLELLMESIRMAGQQTPVILRRRDASRAWQIVSGFRRIEALQRLKCSRVIARLYDQMSDEEAIKAAVLDNFFSGELSGEQIDAFLERMNHAGLLTTTALEFLDWAREKADMVASAPSLPSGPPAASSASQSAALPALIEHTLSQLSQAGQGLEQIFLNWSDVDAADRKLLAAECKYIHDLYPFLTR